jgi:hypothetical protein
MWVDCSYSMPYDSGMSNHEWGDDMSQQQISIPDQLKLQAELDAITRNLPMDTAFEIQAAFDKPDALQRQDALDAATVALPLSVELKLQAIFDALLKAQS